MFVCGTFKIPNVKCFYILYVLKRTFNSIAIQCEMFASICFQIQLSLTPQQTGELRIVGIAYSLGSSSHNQMAVSYPGLYMDSNGPKPSFISSINVRGKQRLDVQGPRLNNTKEEKASKMYGPDRRLDPIIYPEMPLLQVGSLLDSYGINGCTTESETYLKK